MLRKKLSILPAAFVMALLALVIGVVPTGASARPLNPLMKPGMHLSPGAPTAPPVTGHEASATQAHAVSGSSCSSWTQMSSPNPRTFNYLYAVTAQSASDAWAVGTTNAVDTTIKSNHQILALRWNGKSWKQVSTPTTSTDDYLYGVTGNAMSAWAVGYTSNGIVDDSLILQWNGTSWSQVPSPNPSTYNVLYAVVGDTKSAWAVGYSGTSSIYNTLILHWNGTSWSQIASPSPAQFNYLYGVEGSDTNAWATGMTYTANPGNDTLILHWNGISWSRVSSPNPSTYDNSLRGVTGSGTSVWAAGYYYNTSNDIYDTLIEQWNGTSWSQVSSSNPGSYDNELFGVDGGAKNAFAVGYTFSGGPENTLTERWNGSAWNVVSSPNPGRNNILYSVAQVGKKGETGSHFWAVGDYDIGSGYDTLILQC